MPKNDIYYMWQNVQVGNASLYTKCERHLVFVCGIGGKNCGGNVMKQPWMELLD